MCLQVSYSQNTHTISLIKIHQMCFSNSIMNFTKYKITSDSECTFWCRMSLGRLPFFFNIKANLIDLNIVRGLGLETKHFRGLRSIQIRTVTLDLNGTKPFISIIPKHLHEPDYLEPKWPLWKKFCILFVSWTRSEQIQRCLLHISCVLLRLRHFLPPIPHCIHARWENVNARELHGSPQLMEICAIRLWPAGGAHVHLSNWWRLTLSRQV